METRSSETAPLGRRWTRGAAAGFSAGAGLTLVTQLLFPLFFDAPLQLLVLPLAAAAIAAVIWTFRSRSRPFGRRARVAVGVLLLLPALVYWAQSRQRNWSVSPRVLMIGLDGASWNVLSPVAKKGGLPVLSSFRTQGVSGVLQSFEPMYSPVIWTSIATGQPPAVHGITSFYARQEQLRQRRIWDVISEQGGTVGVFRWWITWPPKQVSGFLVPGLLARDPSSFPPDVEYLNRLRLQAKSGADLSMLDLVAYAWRFLRAGMSLDTTRAIAWDLLVARRSGDPVLQHAARRRTELRLNATVFGSLLRRHEPDFASFYDNGIDVLAHYYWKYGEPEIFDDVSPDEVERYGTLIPDYVELVDATVGQLLSHVSDASTVLVLSDHGVRGDPDSARSRLSPDVAAVLADLDMAQGFYGINLAALTTIESIKAGPEARLEAIAMARNRLETLREVETGLPVFEVEMQTDARLYLRMNPEISPAHHVQVEDRKVALDRWVSQAIERSGTHHLEGVLMGRGPGVLRGQPVRDATVLDIAPTVLYLAGAPVAEDLAGRVLTSLLTPEYLAAHPVRTVQTYGAIEAPASDLRIDEETTEALRALGYVD